MIANTRHGDYSQHMLAAPLRSVGPEPDGLAVTTSAVAHPVVGVINDSNVMETQWPDPKRASFHDPARVAVSQMSYTLRPMYWRAPWFNGSHGVIRRLRPGSWDSQQRPLFRPSRTLRSAPAAPWDVGTALGPAGYAEGVEE